MCYPPRPWRHSEIFSKGVDAICAQQLLQEIPPVPRHSRRRFDSSSTTRSGDHRTPIGSRSRWGHRGDVQDADSLDRPESGKWTSISSVTRYCTTGSALGISTAKPTICAAGCELVLHNGTFFGVTASVSWRPATAAFRTQIRRRSTTVLLNGAQLCYKADDGLWWLEKIGASTTTDGIHLACFLDDPGPIKLPLSPVSYTISTGAARGSWCLQVHLASAFARGLQGNVDESRGAAVDKLFSHHRCAR